MHIYSPHFAYSFRFSEVSGAHARTPRGTAVLTRAGGSEGGPVASGVYPGGGGPGPGRHSPDHVVDHLANGNLQRAERLVGRQNVGQAGEAEHAGDGKEHLRQELGVLRAPLTSLCAEQHGG